MTWSYEPLDTIVSANEVFFTDQLAKGDALLASAEGKIDALIAQGIAAVDFSAVTLTQPDASALSLTLPTAPTATTITSPALGSDPVDTLIVDLIDTVSVQLNLRLINKTGLDASIEVALWNRARDRETAAAEAAAEDALAGMASRGFSMPTGAMLTTLQSFSQVVVDKVSDINREIMITQANLEQSNTQKTLDSLVTLANTAQALFNSQEDVMTRRVELLNALNQTLIENKKSEISIYAAQSSALSAKSQFLMSQLDVMSRQSTDIAQLELAKIKDQADFEIGKYQAIGQSTQAVGSILGQYAATLANMMNYSMSFGYGTHYSGDVSVSV